MNVRVLIFLADEFTGNKMLDSHSLKSALIMTFTPCPLLWFLELGRKFFLPISNLVCKCTLKEGYFQQDSAATEHSAPPSLIKKIVSLNKYALCIYETLIFSRVCWKLTACRRAQRFLWTNRNLQSKNIIIYLYNQISTQALCGVIVCNMIWTRFSKQ